MSDNNTSSGVTSGATPAPDTQPATGNAPGGATPQKPAVTLEEALAQLAEEKRVRAALEHEHKNATGELKRHRERLTAYEAAEKQAQEAQLSEVERLKKQHTELQSQHAAYTKQTQERIVRYEVERQASKLGIIDPEAAAKLLDWSELEYEEDGTPKNATRLLEVLIKNKPYLAPKPTEPAQTEQASMSPAQTAQSTRQAPVVPAMNPGRTSIAQPGQIPPGKPATWSDVFKRP